MRRWAALGSFLLVATVVGAPRAQALERAIAAAEALGARTGVAVVDADGTVLHRHRALEAFAPASNMKLLTAAAVVRGLGAEFEFTTRFRLRGGRLVVTASGDPNWIHGTEHDPAVVFGAVAAALRARGVRALAGVELDGGSFAGPDRPPTWPRDQLHTWYCAPTGPFVLEQGTFALRLEAPRGAVAAAVQLVAPAVGDVLRGTVPLVDRAKDATYGAIDRGDAVHVRGRFPRKSPPVEIRVAVADPARWYEGALRHALAQAGITVGGAPTAVADQLVHEHRSGLRDALQRMLEDSSNFDAEQCLRVLGAQLGDGSLAGGVAALRTQVEQLVGRVPDGAEFVDGSGLSKQNRLTPGLLAVALVQGHGSANGELLRACLPVAGRTGTLDDRFLGTDLVGRVRAKTGWIRGASALSGVVEGEHGSRYFAILMNYPATQNGLNRDLKRLQEDIVRAIDRLEPSR